MVLGRDALEDEGTKTEDDTATEKLLAKTKQLEEEDADLAEPAANLVGSIADADVDRERLAAGHVW